MANVCFMQGVANLKRAFKCFRQVTQKLRVLKDRRTSVPNELFLRYLWPRNAFKRKLESLIRIPLVHALMTRKKRKWEKSSRFKHLSKYGHLVAMATSALLAREAIGSWKWRHDSEWIKSFSEGHTALLTMTLTDADQETTKQRTEQVH